MEGLQVSNRSANTHRRQMRPLTPVTRATRGTAGVAFAATFVLTGSTGALADGTTQADAPADSANVIAPVAAPAVTIPAAQKHDGTAFGVFAAESAALKPKAPVAEVEETETRTDREEHSSNNESRRSSRNDEDRSNRNEEQRSDRNDEDRSSRNAEQSTDREEREPSRSEKKSESREAEVEDAPNSSVASSSIFATAKRGIGVPYVFGGGTTSGWDCSGFTSWVYRQHGINLPHSASAQARMGKRVSASEARPGDLVYHPGHVGIYAGNGMILDAGRKATGTSIRKLWKANWSYYRIVD